MRPRPSAALASSIAILALVSGACGASDHTTVEVSGPRAATTKPLTLRLGYFPNLTHAQALIGVADGTFREELGDRVRLETRVLNAGPAAIEALFAGEIDAAYLGPNPAINGYQKSNGEALRIVSGAASGGALLIVRRDANINSPADLAGKKLATPQLGGTQDVALRSFLRDAGLKTTENGGKVTILPAGNAEAMSLFKKGSIQGAWVPEPWATRLVLDADGKVLVDERTLWPNGDFVTTQLIVSTRFLGKNPDAVERLVRANVKLTRFINEDPARAKEITNKAIQDLTGQGLSPAVLDGAWQNLRFTYDPVVPSLRKSASDAFAAGLLGSKAPNLAHIYSLDPLNRVLAELSLPAVTE